MLWDFFATLSATVLIIGMVAKGYFPVVVALPMMIVFVVFKAVARATGGITKLVYYVFMISFFGILTFFALLKGGSDDMFSNLVGAIGEGIVTIVAQILRLASEGHIAIYLAGFAVVALVLARWLGLQLGSKLIYHSIFSIAAPLFVLAVFLATGSGGNWREAFILGGSLLALAAMLQGLYLMLFGAFKKDGAR